MGSPLDYQPPPSDRRDAYAFAPKWLLVYLLLGLGVLIGDFAVVQWAQYNRQRRKPATAPTAPAPSPTTQPPGITPL